MFILGQPLAQSNRLHQFQYVPSPLRVRPHPEASLLVRRREEQRLPRRMSRQGGRLVSGPPLGQSRSPHHSHQDTDPDLTTQAGSWIAPRPPMALPPLLTSPRGSIPSSCPESPTLDILPSLKAGDSSGPQARHRAAPASLRWVPASDRSFGSIHKPSGRAPPVVLHAGQRLADYLRAAQRAVRCIGGLDGVMIPRSSRNQSAGSRRTPLESHQHRDRSSRPQGAGR